MPQTSPRAEILRNIAANRSPESFVGGTKAVKPAIYPPPFPEDLELFHDLEGSIAQSAVADTTTLREAGYNFSWLLGAPTFQRVLIMVSGQQLKLEWAYDSAFRFFPVQKDDLCGYRLHDADAATNKVLALAGRSEIRDFVDVLHQHDTYLSLGALVWAASGKDPGLTPEFLLDQMGRHVAYRKTDLDRLSLRKPLDLRRLKRRWIAAVDSATTTVSELPPEEVGCLYLGPDLRPRTSDPASPDFPRLTRHYGRVRGAWPTISPYLG